MKFSKNIYWTNIYQLENMVDGIVDNIRPTENVDI